MIISAFSRRKAGRRLLAALFAASALASATPAFAQAYPSSGQDTTNDGTRDRDGSDTRTDRSTGNSGRDASTNQIQTNDSDRYKADEIQSSSQARDDKRSSSDDEESNTRRRNDDERDQRTVRPKRIAPPSEYETFVSTIVDKPLRRFGANLLVPESRDFTTPATTTVPSDYRINPGDELILGLTGSVQADGLRLTVDSNGRVFVPRVGAITVAGSRYSDLQSVIARQVSRQYRNFHVAVSVGRLHGITVYVTGFAQTPGSYTVSSLSTLVNAVLAAGGPSAGGSFRSIQLRRNGQLVSDFDLYDLLLKGDKTADAVLQNGDVIYVAPAGAQIAVIGSVNNEAIYEGRPGDTLTDVLIYAGGASTVADDTRLMVLDPLDVTGGWQQITPEQARGQTIRRAQVLRVLSGIGIARPLAQQPVLVTVNGEVAKPGRYYVQPGTSLAAAITQAGGLTPEAYAFGAVLTRDSVRQQQQTSYKRALADAEFLLTAQPLTSAAQADQNQLARVQALRTLIEQMKERKPDGRLVLDVQPDAPTVPGDIVLENNDTLYVPARPVTVGVFGSVPSPASFRYRANAKVGDYIKQAGGVQKIGAKSEIFVVRANGTLLAPKRGAFHGSILNDPALPGDLIFVPINPSRGEFWARIRDLSAILFQGAIAAAAVSAISQ
jgi:protein involved in polysaccharide export with SLBB domain